MWRRIIIVMPVLPVTLAVVSFVLKENTNGSYRELYNERLAEFTAKHAKLTELVLKLDPADEASVKNITEQINYVRTSMKGLDFWLRYLEPVSYRMINGPLPVEWENEVFEKFEKPYKREGAGLSLAAIYIDEGGRNSDTLCLLLQASSQAFEVFNADTVTVHLGQHHHFFLCNRLFLLNLAAIYTTGFECPDTERIVPELRLMLSDVKEIYDNFNHSFPGHVLSESYLRQYNSMVAWVNAQPDDHIRFDNFTFISRYVNRLFALNQEMIRSNGVVSRSYVDYSLSKSCNTIFGKSLYYGQNHKGIFNRVNDANVMKEIENTGKLLFYDPLLSGNNLRSCASCHKPDQYFTDTVDATPFSFDQAGRLPRNTPTLLNATYNHLIMLDGRHVSLSDQARDVITNPLEMSCAESDVLRKVLSCPNYKKAFKAFLRYTPQEKDITMQHISSAITLYYGKFSKSYSPFDRAMNEDIILDEDAKKGFNLFMGKAQCGTCHFVPQFNGVKPPYVSSEFEVLGVPTDLKYSALSPDKGRYAVNPAIETENAFRTGTVRNAARTKPYMHNGVFKTLEEVLEFYDTGGGKGHGLNVGNQTLSADSLHLTAEDKKFLLAFINSLNEDIEIDHTPEKLPVSKIKSLNKRKPGGEY